MAKRKQYTDNVHFRLTPALRQKIKQDAKAANLKEAEYVRRLIDHKEIISREAYQDRERLIYEINKIGVNINQLAYHANAGTYSYMDAIELTNALKMLEDVLKELYTDGHNQSQTHERSQKGE